RGKDATSLTVQHERLHRQMLRELDRRPRRKPSKTAATRQSCATNARRAQFWARVSPCTVPTASAARWLLRSTRGPRRCRPSGRTPPSPERERFSAGRSRRRASFSRGRRAATRNRPSGSRRPGSTAVPSRCGKWSAWARRSAIWSTSSATRAAATRRCWWSLRSRATTHRSCATPRSMTLMAGPIDARKNPTQVDRVATTRSLRWFEMTAIQRVPAGEPGFLRKVYPGFLQLTAFVSLNVGRHADAHRRLYRDLLAGDEESAEVVRRFYDDYLAVMDLPAEYYLQTIASVFQRHHLARGEMVWRGKRPVRPAAIEATALFTVEGEKDDITGRGQTFAAHDLCTSIPAGRRQEYLQSGAGHYGVFSGRRWRE